jgi:hypothetical protein
MLLECPIRAPHPQMGRSDWTLLTTSVSRLALSDMYVATGHVQEYSALRFLLPLRFWHVIPCTANLYRSLLCKSCHSTEIVQYITVLRIRTIFLRTGFNFSNRPGPDPGCDRNKILAIPLLDFLCAEMRSKLDHETKSKQNGFL